MANQHGSSYTDYAATHRTYDLTRLAVAGEQILALIEKIRPLASTSLVDAGCGTGLHLQSFHAAGVGKLIGVDASPTGLQQCRQKLGDVPNVQLDRGDIRILPLANTCADVVFFSWVLHHLPRATRAQQRRETSTVINESLRVLRPSGQLIILTSSRTQLDPDEGSIWYYRYFRAAARSLARRFMPLEKLCLLLSAAGYTDIKTLPVEQTYYTADSLNPRGPTLEDWRNGDSLFAYYRDRPNQLSARLRHLEKAISNGEVERWIEATVSRTENLKQGTLVVATKPTT